MNPFTKESKLSTALQVVSILAVASALLGFLIVNMYLAIFGFWDFNFLKTQYFSAGGLFLFFVSLPAIFFYAFFKAKEILEKYRIKDPSTIKSVLVFVAKFVLFAVVFGASFFGFIFPLSFSTAQIQPAGFIVFLGIVWTAIIFGMVATLIKSHGEITEVRYRPINLKNIGVYFYAHYRLLYTLIVVPILILIFSFFLYSTIPRYFGGGKPVAVSIALDSTFNNTQMGVSNPFDAFLVYQSSDVVLVLTNGGTYLLRQDNIAYIKYLEGSIHIKAIQNFSTGSTTASTSTPQ